MTGEFYSNMPDTTSRTAPYRRSLRRLVASTLLFTSSLLLVTSMGVAQDDLDNRALFADETENNGDVTCEQFNTPEDAELYVQQNPDAEIALDSDGNGVVCDEDEDLFTNSFDDDDFNNEAQYEDNFDDNDVSVNQVQQPPQTPATGGVALLPLAGSALTAGAGGFMLLRRK